MKLETRMAASFTVALLLALTVAGSANAAPPAVSIDPSPTASYTTAQVSGTVDPEDNNTFYSFEYSTDGVSWSGFAFETPFAAEVAANSGATKVSGELAGLTPGTQYSVRLAAVNFVESFPEGLEVLSTEPNPTFTTEPVALPTVSISTPSQVTGTSAHLSGEINPGAPVGNPSAFDVGWHFECTPECPGLAGGSIPADSSTHAVEVDATGLLYNTTYEVRLIASNAGGEASAIGSFKTEAVAPEVESSPVGTLSATTAILGGQVDPNGSSTTYWIEYADNEGFTGAASIPATKDASAGSGQTPVIVSQLLTGLQPNSGYFFRVTAKSAVGTVVSTTRSFHTRVVESAHSCSNEALRNENNSADLPDCRAYELVSPDLNHAALNREPSGLTAPDGETMVYTSIDAPQHAHSGGAFSNFVRATRSPTTGWAGVSLAASLPAPVTSYLGTWAVAISPDLSSIFEWSDQPLTDGTLPSGQNGFLRRADGTYRLVTAVGSPFHTFFDAYSIGVLAGGTPDFSHVFFRPAVAQLESDPTTAENTYSWSEEQGLHLLGILPDGTAAPGGAVLAGLGLPAVSTDGRYVTFSAEGKLYLRTDEAHTDEIGVSQRTVPDPNPPAQRDSVGVTSDGSKVLFTSRAELTDSANTGESGGVPNDAGRDLYSYDIAGGQITDLTADTNPLDAQAGADIQNINNGPPIVGATADGSYVYFTAKGDLAPGATPGHTSLYVWHEGVIQFLARADKMLVTGRGLPFRIAADGRHLLFASSDSLTGYDNTDPVTGEPHNEVFEVTLGSGIECASCRANGQQPTGDSQLPNGIIGNLRSISDDGNRVFFEGTDAVVPQASSRLQQVFEYSNGRASVISPVSGPEATLPGTAASFLDASASGDDVFIATYDELVPNRNGGDDAVYDARVNGGFPVNARHECSGASCRGSLGSAPVFGAPSSASSSGNGNLAPSTVKPKTAAQLRAAKLKKALKACKRKQNKRRRLSCEKSARKKYKRSK